MKSAFTVLRKNQKTYKITRFNHAMFYFLLDYAALLTGRSSLDLKNDTSSNDLNKNNVVATGRFTFHKKNLHYSFYISEKAARPRSLHFLDSQGNILEEFTLSHAGGLVNSLYQNATRKVCGIWRRLPRDYRR